MIDSNALPGGTNLRLLLEECQCDDAYLLEHSTVQSLIETAIQEVGFQHLVNTGHKFEGGGYTSAFILAESHVIIHTWPENNRIAIVDISVCDFKRPNRARTLALGDLIAAIFQAKKTIHEVLPMIPRIADNALPAQGYHIEIEKIIASRKSAFQNILIAETKPYGRALVLDGVVQISESDDFYYHEPLVHVAMLSHQNPQHVLICGGGDGGAAKQVIKHSSVESCTIVDIDKDVVELSKKELFSVHQGAFDDPRVDVNIQDAEQFIAKTDAEYDVIIIDTTDPAAVSETLFSQDFFNAIHAVLAKDGCLTLHVGSPFAEGGYRETVIEHLDDIFKSVHPYMNFVPCYGALLCYLVCFKSDSGLIKPEIVDQRLKQRGIDNLSYINPEIYQALFAIPPCINITREKQ